MKRYCRILGMLLLILSLAGCGKVQKPDSGYAALEKNINNFCDTLADANDYINDLDPDDEDSPSLLLHQLDNMEQNFQAFSTIEFPEEYRYLSTYTKEASQYMTEAVNSYHAVYEADAFDVAKESYARENYNRAMKRVKLILAALRGEQTN